MIIRAPRPDSHFTLLRNDVVRRQDLSFKARGLLAFMLSHPDNWRFRIDDLVKAGVDGRHAITTALDELEKATLITRRKTRRPDGTWQSQLIVFDTPQLGITPVDNSDATAGYPRRITMQLIEDCEKKNVQRGNALTYKGPPRLCGKCNGSGHELGPFGDDISDCSSCGGQGFR